MKLFRCEVVSRTFVTPGMVRLGIGGEELASFASTGVGDEYLRLFFPNAETGQLVFPEVDENGRWSFPDGVKPPHTPAYTVRRFDRAAGTVDIDFVVHQGGRAADWAYSATRGDAVVLSEPKGILDLSIDCEWMLLVCDATGLPAAARLIEELPPKVAVSLIAEVAEPTHRMALGPREGLQVTWIDRSGNGVMPSSLEDAVKRASLPTTPGQVWVAGERRMVRGIRRYLRHELLLPANRYDAVAYWTDRGDEWFAGWQQLDSTIRQQIEAAWRSDRDSEEVADEVDAILTHAGL